MTFARALLLTLDLEGGLSDHPADHGGLTKYGITQRVYDAWRSRHGLSARSVADIERDEMMTLYYADYWSNARCDEFSWPISAAVFDAAVHHGVKPAIKLLQRALKVKDDGLVGPKTLYAAEDAEPFRTTLAVNDERTELMCELVKRDATQLVFLSGWMARVRKLDRILVSL